MNNPLPKENNPLSQENSAPSIPPKHSDDVNFNPERRNAQIGSDSAVFDAIDTVLGAGKAIFTGVTRFFGRVTGKYEQSVDYFKSIAKKIINLRSRMIELSDEELAEYTNIFKQRLERETLDDILVEAFAVVREAARRVLNEEPYMVQLMGGIALHKGMVAEMRTGEGKTLVAAAPAYLNALSGKGVYVVTVNDYLAQRDARITGQIFSFLGLKVDCVTSDMGCDIRIKKKAYDADVTYVTNSEVGFDFLRDNMALEPESIMQRPLHYAIIDEVDSILIDEARTPLIISSAPNMQHQKEVKEGYLFANSVVTYLDSDDYTVNLKEHDVKLKDTGIEKIEQMVRESGILGDDASVFLPQHTKILHRISQCLKAHNLYIRDKDYVVQKERIQTGSELVVKIVDEHTGRILAGRRYSDGLHQAIEAKEGVQIKPETNIVASITYRCLFKLFKKIGGMTGTAKQEAEEFEKIYGLHCVEIPTHKPNIRKDHPDILCGSQEQKVQAILKLAKERHQAGQPLLICTVNVNKSDYYYKRLITDGGLSPIHVNVLSAKHHEKEAEIIANAGRERSVTVVTKMAGRGTDIKLGGDLQATLKAFHITDEVEKQRVAEEIAENKDRVIAAGGLYVIGTEHSSYRRADQQLLGRAGRQGDPGEGVFFAGPEDTIFEEYDNGFANKLKMFFADEPEQFNIPAIAKIQESVEAMHFESRHTLQRYSDIKEFYMLQFYEKRRGILMRPIVTELGVDFYNLVENQNAVKWFQLKKTEYTKESLIEAYNHKMKGLAEEKGDRLNDYIRPILLKHLDQGWSNYLEKMTDAREAASFQQYAQKDPIVYYARIAEDRFREEMREAFYRVFDILLQDKMDEEEEFDYEELLRSEELESLANFFNEMKKNENENKAENRDENETTEATQIATQPKSHLDASLESFLKKPRDKDKT